MNNKKRKISICSYRISMGYEYGEVEIKISYKDSEFGYGEFSINIDQFKVDFNNIYKSDIHEMNKLEFNSYEEMIDYFLYSGKNCYFRNLI